MLAHDHQHKSVDAEEQAWAESIWRAYLTGGFELLNLRMRLMAKMFKYLPKDPRCTICKAPFKGIGGVVARAAGRGAGEASTMNPRLCARCEHFVKDYEVGTEMELSVLFADVRGSTRLAEQMGPAAFHELIDRFYRATTDILIEHDALIEKIIGDEVTGLFVPGIAGPDYPRRAVEAAQALLHATGHADPNGPWIPVGVGVHTGQAYVGAVGSTSSVSDITVLGDMPNAASRITAQAAPGEVLISAATAAAAWFAAPQETRRLDLTGREESMTVHVLRVAAPEPAS